MSTEPRHILLAQMLTDALQGEENNRISAHSWQSQADLLEQQVSSLKKDLVEKIADAEEFKEDIRDAALACGGLTNAQLVEIVREQRIALNRALVSEARTIQELNRLKDGVEMGRKMSKSTIRAKALADVEKEIGLVLEHLNAN